MDKKKLASFVVRARANTYAGGRGKVKSIFLGSNQLEYKEGDWLYRDIYNMGNKIFMGLETVYFKNKPVWSMCYYGDFKRMSEREVDEILRKALIEKKETTRLWFNVELAKDGYKYVCVPDGQGSINEISGLEEIYKGKNRIYYLYYAGGFIG